MKRIAVLLGVFCIVSVSHARVEVAEPVHSDTSLNAIVMVNVDNDLIKKAVNADDTAELRRVLEKYDGPLKKEGVDHFILMEIAKTATKEQWDMIIKYAKDDSSFTGWPDIGLTLLHASVSNPKAGLEITKFLVEEKKLDVNARDRNGFTPIFMHSEGANDNDIVAYLLKCGADIEAKGRLGYTPLIHACAGGTSSEQHALNLIAHGANVFCESKDDSPLFAAAKSGQPKAIKAILSAMVERAPDHEGMSTRYWVDRPLQNAAGTIDWPRTALIAAMNSRVATEKVGRGVVKGDGIGAIKALIAAGADVDYRWPRIPVNVKGQDPRPSGETPIYWARNGEIARILIAAGAHVNVRSDWGLTPLETHTRANLSSFLRPAEPIEPIWGGTDIHDRRNEVVEELLKNHADPFPDAKRMTPYQRALTSGDQELIDLFRKYHADVVNPYVNNNGRPR